MKLSFKDDAERDDWEALDDAELVRRVRDGFAAHRARDSLPGNVEGSKEIIKGSAHDDPPRTPGTPPPPERKGASAMDAMIPGYSRIGLPHSDGRTRVLDEDLIVQSPKRAW